jgi:hypothetical protein
MHIEERELRDAVRGGRAADQPHASGDTDRSGRTVSSPNQSALIAGNPRGSPESQDDAADPFPLTDGN